MAASQSLLMDALLAVGGSVMTSHGAGNDIPRKALQCYGKTVSGLRHCLLESTTSEGPAMDNALGFIVTSLLCAFEVQRGNVHGTLSQHFCASRYFARTLTAQGKTHSPPLIGVLVELLANFEMLWSIRSVRSCVGIELVDQNHSTLLNILRSQDKFYILLDSAMELYETIPQICKLGVDRQKEVREGLDLGCKLDFQRIARTILEWRHIPSPTDLTDPQRANGRRAAGKILQNCFQTFLFSSYFTEPAYLRTITQPLVNSTIELIPTIWKTNWLNSTFWPIFVMCTYAESETQRARIRLLLKPVTPLMIRVAEVLQWIWDSPDDVFGLDGLETVICAHQTYYPFA
ncbi:hypothetical protein HJFPF1_11073 [Paramyrothecium foliicola]|nr:hypothetical protein HJFPF1_11073 [Paramyrothecium foliicola]